MLEKTTVIDQINVLEDGQIQVRKTTKIIDDGVEISKAYHRHVLAPGDDLTGQDTRVIAIATAVWTSEVIATYQASLVSQ
jgi:hypothetical protein